MKFFILILIHLGLFASTFHTQEDAAASSMSVVKVFTHYIAPNYDKPWKAGTNSSGIGSGVIVEGKLILTAAHVVTDATYIEVKKYANPKKFFVNVKWIAHDADLALLEVEDESFFEGITYKKLGALPKRQAGVAVYGYPEGGNKISITQGIISRIELTEYSHSLSELLMIQIDAAINFGNSGGPVFNKDGDIVGIAIQSLSNSNNIGYIAPVPVIKHFFDDIKDGKYDGFPICGVLSQTMENNELKKYYGMQDRTGVLVTNIFKRSSSDGYLEQEDILLEIDGHKIADNGTVNIEGLGRISANYLVSQHFVGDNVHIKLLRDKKEQIIEVPLNAVAGNLLRNYNEKPRYYMFGGFMFMPITGRNSLGNNNVPTSFVNAYIQANIIDNKVDYREAVSIRLTLDDKVNAGYSATNLIVTKINDEQVKSFDDLVQKIKATNNRVKITTSYGDVFVLDKASALKAEFRILERYGIKAPSCMW